MHIPDNYLSPATCAVVGAAMIPVWKRTADKIKIEIPKAKIPMLGVGAAFSFLLMMFNVPLPGGTTGHAVGGTLLAILMGPYAACMSVTVALFIQALMFGDGGILSFGVNCFNMAFVLPFVGYGIYKLISRAFSGRFGEGLGIVLGSYIGLNVAALIAAIEFGLQPILFKDALGNALYCPYPLSVSIPAMLIPHLLVAGVVEAVFTLAIVTYIRQVSPGSFYNTGTNKPNRIYGLVVALICLTPLGLLATGTAWGEWGSDEIAAVAIGGKALGYTPTGMSNGFSFNALIPDYALAGMPEVAGYILSAIMGVALVIIIFKVLSGLKQEKVGEE